LPRQRGAAGPRGQTRWAKGDVGDSADGSRPTGMASCPDCEDDHSRRITGRGERPFVLLAEATVGLLDAWILKQPQCQKADRRLLRISFSITTFTAITL
jgi:hypothetical protein